MVHVIVAKEFLSVEDRGFCEFKAKIIYFLKKKRFILKIFIKLVFFSYNYTSTCKTVFDKYGFKVNFKIVINEYGFKINF